MGCATGTRAWTAVIPAIHAVFLTRSTNAVSTNRAVVGAGRALVARAALVVAAVAARAGIIALIVCIETAFVVPADCATERIQRAHTRLAGRLVTPHSVISERAAVEGAVAAIVGTCTVVFTTFALAVAAHDVRRGCAV